jgi:hypothetical protein
MSEQCKMWLQERHDNCVRIAAQKTGEDKVGWSEDAAFFAGALTTIAALEVENKRLKELLSVSDEFRRAYADGKYKLYAMGGEICEAAATHLPMSEGPLERACRKALRS